MRSQAKPSRCCIEEMRMKAWKFVREQSISKGVGFGRRRWIARQKSKWQRPVEEVAKREEDRGSIRKGQGEKSRD